MKHDLKVFSDSPQMPSGVGVESARRLVEDDSLGATELRLEVDDYVLRFKEPRCGTAMLFREGGDNGALFVAIDSYDQSRIIALIDLFAENPESVIASIEWQEDSVDGFFGYIPIVIAIAVVLAAAYGLYAEFFQ